MILQWRKAGASEFASQWQGMTLLLHQNPGTRRWQVAVDGRPTKQSWASFRAAQEGTDVIVGRLLANVVATARQRTLSGERLVHRG